MKYVDNLLEVKPEEIEHIEKKVPIQAIVKANSQRSPYHAVVVVWEDGSGCSYSVDGKYDTYEGRQFIYKKRKVKRLKPLHVVLAENPGYYVDRRGDVHLPGTVGHGLPVDILWCLGGEMSAEIPDYYVFDDRLFEEVEV
jgi:hypothetical protein